MPSLPQASSSSGESSDSWFSSLFSTGRKDDESNDQPKRKNLSEYPSDVQQRFREIALASFIFGAISAIVSTKIYTSFRRIPNAAWVTPDLLKKKWIKGVVTSVGDADGFRFYHTPGFGWRWPLKFRRVPTVKKDLVNNTLSLRIAGIDAPEMSHFGKPAQPYSQEAFEWLKRRIEGKTVYCQLIKRDQYERIVAMAITPRWFLPQFLAPRFGSCLPIEMLRSGYAVVYDQANSAYGALGKDAFDAAEEYARKKKLGMWKSRRTLESPQDYKKRLNQTV